MPMSWQAFFQSGEGRILVLLFFMSVIVFYLFVKVVSSIFRPTSRNLSDSKILGGLSVLMVAIIADNAWIYFLSFFIAGLLIASERFMLLLAAVFNSDRTNVHKIPSYWQEEEKSYDEQELVETIENSVQEGVDSSEETSQEVTDVDAQNAREAEEAKKERLKQYVQKISDIESRALRVLKKRADYKYQLKSSVAVKVDDLTVKYDAIYVEADTNRIVGAFEVKYFPAMKNMNVKAYLGNRAKRYLSTEYKVGFIFVFNSYDYDELNQILKSVEEFEKINPESFVAIYQSEDQSLTPLYETSLKKAFPVGLEAWGF